MQGGGAQWKWGRRAFGVAGGGRKGGKSDVKEKMVDERLTMVRDGPRWYLLEAVRYWVVALELFEVGEQRGGRLSEMMGLGSADTGGGVRVDGDGRVHIIRSTSR